MVFEDGCDNPVAGLPAHALRDHVHRFGGIFRKDGDAVFPTDEVRDLLVGVPVPLGGNTGKPVMPRLTFDRYRCSNSTCAAITGWGEKLVAPLSR